MATEDPPQALAFRAPGADFTAAARAVIAAKESPHTRDAYTRDLAGWIDFCSIFAIDPTRPTLADATKYRDALRGSSETVRRRLATLSSIYRTLRKSVPPVVAGNPFHPEALAWPTAGTVLKSRRVSDEEALAIVNAAREHPRDYALLRLLYDTGWRRAAVATLPRANIRGSRVHTRGKGGKEIETDLPDEGLLAIERWLAIARTSAYLFPSADSDGPMHPATVNKIVDRWARVVAPDAHPHSFRALFARDGHEAGLPSYEIQGAMGHASADMTARYDGKTRGAGVAKQVAIFRAQRRRP